MKVLVACGAGMGSSQLIKMKAQKVLDQMGIENTITHTAIDEARSMARNFDLIIVNERFVETLPNDVQARTIGLKNVLDGNELKEKLLEKGFG